jgi:predicted PurR-regulated permease PerM
MQSPLLDKSVKILLLIFFSFLILYYGKPFLVPFLIASLLAMLVLPLCARLERKMNKIGAVSISLLLLLSVVSLLIYIFILQVSDISDNAVELQKNITQKFNQLREFATNTLGISEQQQQQIIQQQQQSSTGKISGMVTDFFTSFGGFLTSFLIVMVYIFLFLLFRDHFQRFVLKLVPTAEKTNAQTIMHDVRRVSQKYLTGLALMIACLWVMYSIGFSIVGVENAIFFAILCGLLEIVPFVGNLTGVAITLLMTLAQGGSTNMLIWILIVYAVVQFTQSYILEPMIVGREISINPVFTIVGIIGGELLWGIAGMILALPLLGIIKIICDHIEPLKPYGYLIGDEKKQVAKGPAKLKKIIKNAVD